MRIISICPSNTEIVAFLGQEHLLVGIDDYSDWPRDIISLPRLGPDLSIDMDKVEQLDPHLVIASLSVPGMEKNIEQLVKRNIPHIILNPTTFKDIEDDIKFVGESIGKKELGIEQAALFGSYVKQLQDLTVSITEPVKLYWEWWPKPVFTPGKNNWLTEMSQFVGAQNVFDDVSLASVQSDWEDVLRRNPDFICMAWVGVQQHKMKPDLVKKRPNWETLQCIQQDRILLLEEELYCRPSPRLLQGALQLGKKLYPDVFGNLKFDHHFFTK